MAATLIVLSGSWAAGCGGAAPAPNAPASAPPPNGAAASAPATPSRPSAPRATPASAQVQLPPSCALVTLAQVRALLPQASRAEDLGFACDFVDSQQRLLLEVAVRQMGSVSAKHLVNAGGPLVLADLPGVGSSAVYTYQKAAPNVTAHLTALAAVQDGIGVQVLLHRIVAGTAPGEPGFDPWKALLISALARASGATGGGGTAGSAAPSGAGALPDPCGLVTVAQLQTLVPQAAQATPHGSLCAFTDASGKQVLTVAVQREAADARALFFPIGLVTIGSISGIGDSAAYEYQKPDLGVPGHLAAVAAVKGGVGASVVLDRVLTGTAPNEPGFAKWKALLAAVAAKL